MLSIDWTNKGAIGNDSDQFANFFGASIAPLAREIVARAIDDWEAVITDFRYDTDDDSATNNTFQLAVSAGSLPTGIRAGTTTTFSGGKPISANVTMDLNADGGGWFFDSTPLDDAEFTAIAGSFQGSFIDSTTAGQSAIHDFYRTIVHEIGHAMGLTSVSPVFALLSNPLMTSVGADPGPNGGSLYTFHNPNGQYGAGGFSATITTNGGRHVYEGSHPYDLMNPGRDGVETFPSSTFKPTIRSVISDLDVKILVDAYGYAHTLPSTFNSAHVTLDSLTGTLLIQDRIDFQSDTIDVSIEGTDTIKVVLSGTGFSATERVPLANVTQIVIAGNGGSDTITPHGLSYIQAYHVVSSNQDAVETGTLGNSFVDLDSVVPGYQVTLRAAVMDANGGAGSTIYLPRGTYRLTIPGTGGDNQGDLDISQSITIIGTGAGESIVDAGGLGTTFDRVFEVAGTSGSPKTLTLNSLTVMGGKAPNLPSTPWLSHGGGIFVRDYGNLVLVNSAVVHNETTNGSALGGGIYFTQQGGGSITNSVITNNYSASYNGGVYLGGGSSPFAQVTVTASIIAKNSAALPPPGQAWSYDVGAQSANRDFTSGGNNRIGPNNPTTAVGFTAGGDYSGNVDYVVTGVADTYDSSDDSRVLSLREAINKANLASGAEEIWLPAWKFLLTRERRDTTMYPTDVEVGFGDLDIDDTLTIRAVNNVSSVAWRAGVTDRVFELLGDYNGNNSVDAADYVVWQSSSIAADGDDNGIVNQADYYIWTGNFGNMLTLHGIQITG